MPFQTCFPRTENHIIKQCAFFCCFFLVVHPHAAHHRVWSTCCYPPMVGKRVRLTSTQWSQPLSMCIAVHDNGVVPLLSKYHLYYLPLTDLAPEPKPSPACLDSQARPSPAQARFVGAWKCGTWESWSFRIQRIPKK